MRIFAASAFVVGVVAGAWLRWPDRPPQGPSVEPCSPPPRTRQTCDVARWAACTSAMAASTAPRPTVGIPFSVAPEAEQPDAWNERLQELLADCTSGLEVLATDCSAYPCVAAIRPSTEEDWNDDCESSQWLFAPAPVSVRCGDGGLERVDLLFLVDFETVRAATERPENEEQRGLELAVLGQRVDSVLERLPCGPQ